MGNVTLGLSKEAAAGILAPRLQKRSSDQKE